MLVMFGYEVVYGRHSSVIGSAESLADAELKARKDIQYYKDLGYVIHEAVTVESCAVCGGNGTIRPTRGKNKMFGKPCKKCKGKGWASRNALNVDKTLMKKGN